MAQRGRKSAAAVVLGPSPTVHRPPPPKELTEEQKKVWWEVVNRLSSDWFPVETHPMLAQYCRHVIRARNISKLVDDYEASGKKLGADYFALVRQETSQTRSIASLATRMRLSQQSTYDKSKIKPPAAASPLWKDDEEEREED